MVNLKVRPRTEKVVDRLKAHDKISKIAQWFVVSHYFCSHIDLEFLAIKIKISLLLFIHAFKTTLHTVTLMPVEASTQNTSSTDNLKSSFAKDLQRAPATVRKYN